MGHPEEGIEGSGTVTEARAEELEGGGTALEARSGQLGYDGTAVKASARTGIGRRTPFDRADRNRKGFAIRQGLAQRKRALAASQQPKYWDVLTPSLSGDRSSRAPPHVGAAGAHRGARLAALPEGTAIVAALRQLSLATAAQSAAIAALLAAFLGGSRAPLAGSAGPPGPPDSQSELLSALHAANDDTLPPALSHLLFVLERDAASAGGGRGT